MSIPIKPFTFSNGTNADAIEVNSNFDALYDTLAGNIESDNIKSSSVYDSDINWGTGANQISAVNVPIADSGGYFTGTEIETALQEVGASFVPIGSIIPFYDFNGICTFNPLYWEYCNGGAVVSATSPLLGQIKPDLSNRYLVGFGTEGGGDIGSALWDTAAVGNASHQIDIAHTHTISHNHTLSAHTHTGPSHTHTGPSHTHTTDIASFTSGAGSSHTHTGPSHTHTFSDSFSIASSGDHIHSSSSGASGGWFEASSPGVYTNASGSYNGVHTHTGSVSGTTGAGGTGATGAESSHTHTINPPVTTSSASGTGATGADGTGATGVPSIDLTGTDATASSSSLSTTQSIQTRSIRVRYIMRVL